MPMIDVYAPADMFSENAGRLLAGDLIRAVLKAEGFPDPAPTNVQHVTGCYIHRLPASDVHTGKTANARTVRIDVLAAAGGLSTKAKNEIVAMTTQAVAHHAKDADQAKRTFVLIREAAPSGWGIAGEIFDKESVEKFFALNLE